MKIFFLITLFFPLSAIASDFENRSIAPEYSGPTARIESSGMERAGKPQIAQTPYKENFLNDYNFEFENTKRGARVQSEMKRRRDNIIRASQEYILYTNE